MCELSSFVACDAKWALTLPSIDSKCDRTHCHVLFPKKFISEITFWVMCSPRQRHGASMVCTMSRHTFSENALGEKRKINNYDYGDSELIWQSFWLLWVSRGWKSIMWKWDETKKRKSTAGRKSLANIAWAVKHVLLLWYKKAGM